MRAVVLGPLPRSALCARSGWRSLGSDARPEESDRLECTPAFIPPAANTSAKVASGFSASRCFTRNDGQGRDADAMSPARPSTGRVSERFDDVGLGTHRRLEFFLDRSRR